MLEKIAIEGCLSESELTAFAREAFASTPIDGKRILFIVPDSTRSMPMGPMLNALNAALDGRAHYDVMIALGTHPPMSDEEILNWFGLSAADRETRFKDVQFYNHDWQNPEALVSLGKIPQERLLEITEGYMSESPEVRVNKRLLDYDLLCVVGPVFPHEVAGFSGGNKYFFPGVSGPEILNLFHWLGALITNPLINGEKYTPVRAVIDEAASLIPKDKIAFCLNVDKEGCHAIYFGSTEEAWSKAADAAATTHIVELDRPYARVLAVCPKRYDELWVAGKCMYKLECAVEDGGELIIYAPHIDRISLVHGEIIHQIGYHTRDYFLKQMDRFTDIPGGILAHSTHVRGIGEYVDGVERPRIRVTLASGIPEAECLEVNLGYCDPATINVQEWSQDENTLHVPEAGEVLYRLANKQPATSVV